MPNKQNAKVDKQVKNRIVRGQDGPIDPYEGTVEVTMLQERTPSRRREGEASNEDLIFPTTQQIRDKVIPNFKNVNREGVGTDDNSAPMKGKTPKENKIQPQIASKSPVGDRVDIHVDEDMFTGGSESESEKGDSTDGEITSMNDSHDGMSMDEEGVDIPSGNGRHGNERKELLRNDPELLKEMLKEKGKKKKKTAKKSKCDRRSWTRTRSRSRSRSWPMRVDR